MTPSEKSNTESSYDAVAEDYAQKFLDELSHKPFDRSLLERLASRWAGKGRVCDIGTGPGQVARYLHDRGVAACGLDLSAALVEQAIQAHPGIEFIQGDMRKLEFADGSLIGITAFYSIIHIEREGVTAVLREWWRVLQPGGVVVLAFHKGQEVRHLDEWWGKAVNVDFVFFERDEMVGYLTEAGFTIEQVLERGPIPDVEAQTERVYIVAVK